MDDLMQKDAYNVLPAQPLGDYLKAIVDVLQQHERRLAAAEAEDISTRLHQVEGDVRELQGVDLGVGYSGDSRLRAIEGDLTRRSPSDKVSDPCTLVLAASAYAFKNGGGPVALRQGIADKLGLEKADVVVLGEPAETPDGLDVTFRFQFLSSRRENAELVMDSFCKRLQTTPTALMGQKVVTAYRPDPRLDMLRHSGSRVGSGRHTLASSVNALVAALSNAHKRLSDSEFWVYNARRYFNNLKNYRRHRWKDRLPLAAQMLTDNKKALLAIYFRRLARYVPVNQKRKRSARVLKMLLHSTVEGKRRFYHAQCLKWLGERQAKARQERKRQALLDSLARTTARGLRGIAYKTWMAFARRRKLKKELVHALSHTNTRMLYWKYYSALAKYAELSKKQRTKRRLQHKLSHELVIKSAKRCALDAFTRLRCFTQRQQRSRDKHNMALIHDFLQSNNASAQQITEELAARVDDMAGKMLHVEQQATGEMAKLGGTVDKLGNQVDVSLKTLTNTNSVLNKLVDRLISVDEQLDHLDKNKAGRAEVEEVRRRGGPQAVAQRSPIDGADLERNIVRNLSPTRGGRRMDGPSSRGVEGGVPRTSVTPTRRDPTEARTPTRADALGKEAEQLRLLNMERSRMQEVTGGAPPPTSARWAATPPNPTPEETLLRARQWQQSQSRTTSPAKLPQYSSRHSLGPDASRGERPAYQSEALAPYPTEMSSAWRLS
eukprot:TRINITY_DN22468_c0_g1_i1.p1 TRINITY_DN22468_c0_g1~~TRINITY_DN22468_c0_g1_i1.p1  ORF type:complete len:748 (+),score=280.67 TRINITY_DN22468_c0_g1_i1:85-2244(+)